MTSTDDQTSGGSDDGPTALDRFLATLGGPAVDAWRTTRGILRTLRLTIYYALRGKRRWSAVFEQLFEIGNRSLFFIIVTLGVMGMILVLQAGYQANRVTGDLTMLGPLFLQLLLREFAPTITAMMVATRAGTGMAAQIGSMVVTEQVDALRMSAAQPIDYLVVPRTIASVGAVFALTVFGGAVSFGSGMVTANLKFGVSYYTFANTILIAPFDLVIGTVKALAYGVAIPVAACHAGLTVFGGSEGVGRATTRAVVHASLAVVIVDFF
ncbi:MAG: MlaE family ABC transporter permease, partial [Bradymonadaceae bacterium]